MSIRKRKWKTGKGELRAAWVVDYSDQHGKRHLKSFDRKKDADAWLAGAAHEIRRGTHTADSSSVTVGEAGERWIALAENGDSETEPLEASTVAQYRQHLDLHIKPFLGDVKLSRLTGPDVKKFKAELREEGRSAAMVRKVAVSLGSIVADAQDAGLVAQNAVRDSATRKRRRPQGRGPP